MKTTTLILSIGLACAILTGLGSNVIAQDAAEFFVFKEGKVWTVQDGLLFPLERETELPNHITVNTNGTFTVGAYSPRRFAEGQVLAADGMLTSPDGKLAPVIDHVALEAGKTVSSVNADGTTVSQDIKLGPHKVLTTDRVLLGGEQPWMRVIDGLLFTPDGKTIPTRDTITLQQGSVIVQKEGTQLIIGSGRSIMMNEGTKVFGDGRVVSPDGQTTQLTEGQILIIEGVTKLR